jgi:hypothetical protein
VRAGKREAQRALTAMVAEADTGTLARTDATVGELLERWFEQAKEDFSPKTVLETRGFIDRTGGRVAARTRRTGPSQRGSPSAPASEEANKQRIPATINGTPMEKMLGTPMTTNIRPALSMSGAPIRLRAVAVPVAAMPLARAIAAAHGATSQKLSSPSFRIRAK